MRAIDLFCGAGGATEGITACGLEVIGFDRDLDSLRSSRAAGHHVVQCDLSTWPWRRGMRGHVDLLHASPPCQPFSATGSRRGVEDERDGTPWMLEAVKALAPRVVTMENVAALTWEPHREHFERLLAALMILGYEVQWNVLCAADYGVPQTRHRLIVVARNDGGAIRWPLPSHTELEGLFTARWVSMAEALGWTGADDVTVQHWRGAGMAARHGDRPAHSVVEHPAPTVTTGAQRRWLLRSGAELEVSTGCDWEDGVSQVRSLDQPAPTITSRSDNQWQLRPGGWSDKGQTNRNPRHVDRPAPTIAMGKDMARWVWERPSTTVCGDQRVPAPGHHDGEESGSQFADAIRCTLVELAVLQGFRPDYPFRGNRTSVARQIGNALPPALIEVVVRCNLEVDHLAGGLEHRQLAGEALPAQAGHVDEGGYDFDRGAAASRHLGGDHGRPAAAEWLVSPLPGLEVPGEGVGP